MKECRMAFEYWMKCGVEHFPNIETGSCEALDFALLYTPVDFVVRSDIVSR